MARWLLESSTRQRNSKQIVLCEKRHVQAQEEVTARRLTATSTRKKKHSDGTLLSVRANRAAVFTSVYNDKSFIDSGPLPTRPSGSVFYPQ